MAFYFGDNTDIIVSSLFQEISPASGADLSSLDPEEASIEQLAQLLTVSRLVYKAAVERKLSADVRKMIIDCYDQVFVLYCEGNPSFVKRLRRGNHRYLGKMSRSNQRKYWRLAGIINDSLAS